MPDSDDKIRSDERDERASYPGDDVARLREARDAALEAAQSAIRSTTRLTRLLTILNEPASTAVLLDRVLSALSELFAADIVVLLDPAGTGTFAPLAAVGLPEDMIRCEMSDAAGGYVRAAMQTRTPVMKTDVSSDPAVDSPLRELGAETAVWLPVIGSHGARGVLVLARCCPAPFSHADVDLLAAMAYRIALTLEQTQRRVQLEQMVISGREIGRHLDEPEILEATVRTFPRLIGADCAALVLRGPDGVFQCAARSGLDSISDCLWTEMARCFLSERRPGEDGQGGTTGLRETAERLSGRLLGDCLIRTLLVVPVRQAEELQGLLFAGRIASTAFTSDAWQIALLYARQTASALQNARLYRAVRDELGERMRAEQALRASDERFRALVRSVSDVITILDHDGTIGYVSPSAEAVWGDSVQALSGRNILERVHPNDRETMRLRLATLNGQPNATVTGTMRLSYGRDAWRDFEVILTNLLDEPAVKGIVGTYHDVTERKTYEQKLTKLAFRDSLTGLANQAFFRERLRLALTRANGDGRSVALLYLDLDNFKIVNDSLGHAWGDQVLCAVAERVRACLADSDTAARLGGDEFTILLEDVGTPAQVVPLVNLILSKLRVSIRVGNRDLFVGGSMGIAFSTPNQDSADDLLRKADLAMYRAKSNGKGCYAVFDAHLNAAAVERLELELELRQALERNELSLEYQPIVSLVDGRIEQAEALLRWEHPRRGLVTPAAIISVAEETGLIIEIGQRVLEKACHEARRWQDLRPRDLPLALSVNLSARQFRHAGLVSDISRALRDSSLAPESLVIEITETNLIAEPEETIAKLRALRQIGVRLAIDDFGVGYSSLSYLKMYPVDALKIDRSFVQGIERNRKDRAIAGSIVALAMSLDLGVVGEGIETEGQAAQLRVLGCGQGQGYLFAPPLGPRDFEALLQRERTCSRLSSVR